MALGSLKHRRRARGMYKSKTFNMKADIIRSSSGKGYNALVCPHGMGTPKTSGTIHANTKHYLRGRCGHSGYKPKPTPTKAFQAALRDLAKKRL